MNRRLLQAFFASFLVLCLAVPTVVFARELTIDDYTTDHEDAGEGWEYDGENNLALDGYNGGAIIAGPSNTGSEFVITVNGDNTIRNEADRDAPGILVQGDARIIGDCVKHDTLTVETTVNNPDENGWSRGGAAVKTDGNLTVEEITLNATSTMGDGPLVSTSGIYANGNLSIVDSDVNARAVDSAKSYVTRSGIRAEGDMLIDNSNVFAETTGDGGFAIYAIHHDRPFSITIRDSNVTALAATSGETGMNVAIRIGTYGGADQDVIGSISIEGTSHIMEPSGGSVISPPYNNKVFGIGSNEEMSNYVVIEGNVTRPDCNCYPEPEPTPEPTPEPEPTPTPEPEAEPAPAPSVTELPATGDATLAFKMFAMAGSLLAGVSAILRKELL